MIHSIGKGEGIWCKGAIILFIKFLSKLTVSILRCCEYGVARSPKNFEAVARIAAVQFSVLPFTASPSRCASAPPTGRRESAMASDGRGIPSDVRQLGLRRTGLFIVTSSRRKNHRLVRSEYPNIARIGHRSRVCLERVSTSPPGSETYVFTLDENCSRGREQFRTSPLRANRRLV